MTAGRGGTTLGDVAGDHADHRLRSGFGGVNVPSHPAVAKHHEPVGDLERILTRVSLETARPRDLAHLRTALRLLPALRESLAPCDAPLLTRLSGDLGEHGETLERLERALIEEPPMLIRDGGVIARGYDAELDELRDISSNADGYLADLETRERERTGLPSLKVGYNRVHGYYIEISKAQSANAPDDYTRRQTLKGAERYITPELKEFEGKVLSARERALAREKRIYTELLRAHAPVLADLRTPVAGVDHATAAPPRAVEPVPDSTPTPGTEASRPPLEPEPGVTSSGNAPPAAAVDAAAETGVADLGDPARIGATSGTRPATATGHGGPRILSLEDIATLLEPAGEQDQPAVHRGGTPAAHAGRASGAQDHERS